MVNDELATIPLGKSEVIGWKNDNFEENGIVTYPPDFNPSQKYPLVLYIHGGPAAASMMTWSSQAQLYAAQGWVVFQPNYRGSDNLGRQYQGAIRNDAGEGPGRDVIAGMDELKKKGFVDETRMCVSGWSYGGYMTTWMTGHYPDMWKCAVTGASVTNRLDQYNFSDSAGGGGDGGNSPWTSPQNMERTMAQSPISMASKVKAPTLILHDTGDYRVAITESFEWFHALRDNGVTTQFIAYPVYGHSPSDPVHQRDVQRRWIEWMQTYLGPSDTPPRVEAGSREITSSGPSCRDQTTTALRAGCVPGSPARGPRQSSVCDRVVCSPSPTGSSGLGTTLVPSDAPPRTPSVDTPNPPPRPSDAALRTSHCRPQSRLMRVVRAAPQREILDARRAAVCKRNEVMEFETAGFGASAARADERATSLVACPHGAADGCRNVARCGMGRMPDGRRDAPLVRIADRRGPAVARSSRPWSVPVRRRAASMLDRSTSAGSPFGIV